MTDTTMTPRQAHSQYRAHSDRDQFGCCAACGAGAPCSSYIAASAALRQPHTGKATT